MSQKIFWNTELRQFFSGLSSQDALTSIDFFSRDNQSMVVTLVKSSASATQPQAVDNLASGLFIRMGIKEAGDFANGFLVEESSWTKSGVGADEIHSANVSFNTAALVAKMVETSRTFEAVLEFTLQDGLGNHTSSAQVDSIINLDLIRGTEEAPSSFAGTNLIFPVVDALGARGLGRRNLDGIIFGYEFEGDYIYTEPVVPDV